MEKGWRRWNGEVWEKVSLSVMIDYVLKTNIQAVLEHPEMVAYLESTKDDARNDAVKVFVESEKHVGGPLNLQEEREIFDEFRERLYKVRKGLMDIKDFYADEPKDV